MLAITGLQFPDLLHTLTQQDVELDKLYMDVAVYNARVMGAAHTANVVALACRTAIAYRGVAHVTMPVDVQDQTITQDVRTRVTCRITFLKKWGGTMAPLGGTPPACGRNPERREEPAILAGQGALGAGSRSPKSPSGSPLPSRRLF